MTTGIRVPPARAMPPARGSGSRRWTSTLHEHIHKEKSILITQVIELHQPLAGL